MRHKDELLKQIREIRGSLGAETLNALEHQARMASVKRQVGQILSDQNRRSETLSWVRAIRSS